MVKYKTLTKCWLWFVLIIGCVKGFPSVGCKKNSVWTHSNRVEFPARFLLRTGIELFGLERLVLKKPEYKLLQNSGVMCITAIINSLNWASLLLSFVIWLLQSSFFSLVGRIEQKNWGNGLLLSTFTIGTGITPSEKCLKCFYSICNSLPLVCGNIFFPSGCCRKFGL